MISAKTIRPDTAKDYFKKTNIKEIQNFKWAIKNKDGGTFHDGEWSKT